MRPLSHNNQGVEGTLAQLVEQRTENPCVPGSIPGGTTHLSGSPADAGQEFLEVPQKKPL